MSENLLKPIHIDILEVEINSYGMVYEQHSEKETNVWISFLLIYGLVLRYAEKSMLTRPHKSGACLLFIKNPSFSK